MGLASYSSPPRNLRGNGFLCGLTESLPTVSTPSDSFPKPLTTSLLLRSELSVPWAHLPGSSPLLVPSSCLLGFSLLRFHPTCCPLVFVLHLPSWTELPGFSWHNSVLALLVPNCWQIARFDFIVSDLQNLSLGTKSPGTSGPLLLPPPFAPSRSVFLGFPFHSLFFKAQLCLSSSAQDGPSF